MTNINEDYVSFETAELLKKKGFDSESITAYYFFMEGSEPILNRIEPQHFVNQYGGNISLVGCPTLQMAMKWLREIHNLHVDIDPSEGDWKPNIIELENWSCVDNGEISICNTYEQACEAAIKYCLENLVNDEQKPINSTLEEKSRIDDAFTKMMLKKPTE